MDQGWRTVIEGHHCRRAALILGGRGSFAGTVGGAILLTTLGTVISALGMDQGWRTVIEGAIIVGALLLLREDLIARLRNRSAG